MREVGTVLGGIGVLIGIYLFATNAQGVATVADGIAKAGTSVISTLQGRGNMVTA